MIGVISYLAFFGTVAAILAIAVLGLNLQWGNTGLFNGGVAAFFGVGAYGAMILGGPADPQAAPNGSELSIKTRRRCRPGRTPLSLVAWAVRSRTLLRSAARTILSAGADAGSQHA